MTSQRATALPTIRSTLRQLAALALIASTGAAAQPPSEVSVGGSAYPLASGEQLPEWLQVEVVIFRHTTAVDERPRPDPSLAYPMPLIELADPVALAAAAAARAEQRGIALLGEQLPATGHDRWQQALIDDLTTLYNPFYTEPLAPPAADTTAAPDQLEGLDEQQELEEREKPSVSLAALQIEPSYWQLTPEQLTLRDSARAIARRDSYQLLSHFGWRQPAAESSPWLAVAGGQPTLGRHPLEGAIRLVKSRFNHIETKLWWAQLGIENPTEQPLAAMLAELGSTPLSIPALPELLIYRLNAEDNQTAALPAWSITEQLLNPHIELGWPIDNPPLTRWTLAMAPFRLSARITARPPLPAPLALDNAEQRLAAATAAPELMSSASYELPQWQGQGQGQGQEQKQGEGQGQLEAIATLDTAKDKQNWFTPQELIGSESEQAPSEPMVEKMLSVEPEPQLRVAQLWSISQRRRVDAGSDYYLDHPVVSLIVRVTEVAPEFTAKPGVELPVLPAEPESQPER